MTSTSYHSARVVKYAPTKFSDFPLDGSVRQGSCAHKLRGADEMFLNEIPATYVDNDLVQLGRIVRGSKERL